MISIGETPCAPILTPSPTGASALHWGEDQHSPKRPCAPSAPHPSSPHEADSSERSPQSSSRSHVQEMGMQRPLAQENWLGEQVRAGPGRDRQSFSSWWCLALLGEMWGTTPQGSCEAQAQKSNWLQGGQQGRTRPQNLGLSPAAGREQRRLQLSMAVRALSLCSLKTRQAPHLSRWSWTHPHYSRSRCPHRRASGWGCSGCSCT